MVQLPVHRLSKKFSQNREDAIQNRIHYWKRVKHMMELHEVKEKSIHFRQKMLQDQIKTNYQNEFDKIRGALAHSVLSAHSKNVLERRENELKSLGATIA
jgi:hypothetical protein